MFEALLSALVQLSSPDRLAYMALGVAIGYAIGVLPALGGLAGLSLVLPFIYGLDQVSALAMLTGLVAVAATADTYSSILMGIPGSSASQATILDGFPMARRGEAARALSASFIASMIGGLVGAVILSCAVLVARPLILALGTAELFMLAVLGLSMVGVLAGRSFGKGLVACGLGLALGTIGSAPATAEYRLDFGTLYLSDGLPLPVLVLAIFALPEIVDLARGGGTISKTAELGKGWIAGLRDIARHWWLLLRTSTIGSLLGAIPGLGGSVTDWIVYGHAVQTEKNGQFGKGDVRGVIAVEASNNAREGGALVPTLFFGIPSSGSMAVFLGGMTLIGIEAGPQLVGERLDLTYAIIWSLAIANVMGTGLCFVTSPLIAKLTTIRFGLIAPFMVMIVCFGAFNTSRDAADLYLLLAVGVLGLFMRRFGWPRPPFVVGFVLAQPMETYLYQAVQFYGWSFVERPGVLIIAAMIALFVFIGARQRRLADTDDESDKRGHARPQAIFALVPIAIFAAVLLDATKHSFLGAVFPGMVAAAMLVISIPIALKLAFANDPGSLLHDGEEGADESQGGFWTYLFWFAGLILGSALVGFLLASIVFFLAFLRVAAKCSWTKTLVLTAIANGGLVAVADILVLDFPNGLLQSMIDLPWPLR
ncbi:tripartite tricarboxylate transporter permease [Roseomonas stagni]|uniref:Tripartite tricarboxylate transporter permease n=1 Tax=Falsiroseomonas algicola TaxID=2716930 RepID=A0A6M1LIE7_9PROT|nr:tripartite tricarboxylate transporter permease [Falsiroseomonas algicola]NGM20031.1 tripartite tricarboxylate transporter permease [Falsiroseomonas algicola]